MGYTMGLVINGNHEISDSIREDYYRFLRQKEIENFHQNSDGQELYADVIRDFTASTSRVFVSLYKDMRPHIAEAGVYDIFDQNGELEHSYAEVYNEDIGLLLERLRTAKELTKKENTYREPESWEKQYELDTIALCEFALRHGYGVYLSF